MSKKKIALLILGMLLFEGLRLFIPIDKLANEIQIISATPYLYVIYKVIRHLHHKPQENHIHVHVHHNDEHSPEALAKEIHRRLEQQHLKQH